MSLICWVPVWFAIIIAGDTVRFFIRGDYAMPRIPVITPTWEWIRARVQDVIDRATRKPPRTPAWLVERSHEHCAACTWVEGVARRDAAAGYISESNPGIYTTTQAGTEHTVRIRKAHT